MAGNAGFQCKQFFIAHNDCAMKVGTDGLLLGSWSNADTAQRILDIGTGSGLIAIMLAQKSADNTQIVGIDIDESAILQARSNAKDSAWNHKLSFSHDGLQTFRDSKPFDLIVSNPPFFPQKDGALQPDDANYMDTNRRQARHTISLNFTQLAENVARLLAKNGNFDCILPCEQSSKLIASMHKQGLFCELKVAVRSRPFRNPIRNLMRFSYKQKTTQLSEITIYDEQNEYSACYKQLCKDFYLRF